MMRTWWFWFGMKLHSRNRYAVDFKMDSSPLRGNYSDMRRSSSVAETRRKTTYLLSRGRQISQPTSHAGVCPSQHSNYQPSRGKRKFTSAATRSSHGKVRLTTYTLDGEEEEGSLLVRRKGGHPSSKSGKAGARLLAMAN